MLGSPRFERTPGACGLFVSALVFSLGLIPACKCSGDGKTSPSSAASAAPPVIAKPALPPSSRCREIVPGKSFEVSGSAAKSQKQEPLGEDEATVDSEDDIPLPFAAELGAVQASSNGFVLGALRARGHESHAAAMLVELNADHGKVIELGRVHGDPEPPTVAFRGNDLIAIVPDNDAGGGMLRVGIIEDPKGGARLTWGDDIVGVRREAGVGGVGLAGEQAFIVFVSERKGQASLSIARFDPKTGKRIGEPEQLATGTGEAEMPRLIARKDGYWLGFLERENVEKPANLAKVSDASQRDTEVVLQGGAHTLKLMSLDANGRTPSRPIALTPARKYELLFDIAPLPNGEAIIAFRDDDTAPGAESGALSVVRVRPDGSKEPIALPGEKLEAGSPALLVDRDLKTPVAPPVWLAATGERNATWFTAISNAAVPSGPLQADTLVRGAAFLSVHRGNILIGRSKGTAVDLSVIECNSTPLPAPLPPPEPPAE
jgi:hypothetical protein